MIVRILNEGQWVIDDAVNTELNGLDDAVEHAVKSGDQAELAAALHLLLEKVRTTGTPVPDDELEDSDLILPASDSTLAELEQLLSESEEGLIPG